MSDTGKKRGRPDGGVLTPRLRGAAVVLLIALAGCYDSDQEQGSLSPIGGGKPVVGERAGASSPGRLEILYPFDEAVFPPEVVAPSFQWKDAVGESDAWLITFRFSDGSDGLSFKSLATEWTVPDESWEEIKQRSRGREARITISGVRQAEPETVFSQASVRFSTSPLTTG